MTCTSCQAKLSAYLDGELSDGEGSALRGHLRTCAACSEAAASEAKIIDGLRQLPAMDPPPAMWQAIRSQLATQEIADAEAPLFKRWARKLAPMAPWAWRGLGGLAAATAAVALLWWLRAPGDAPGQRPAAVASGQGGNAAASERAAPPASPLEQAGVVVGAAMPPVDVAVALGDEVTMIDRSYRDAVDELVAAIDEEKASWAPAFARRYDDKVRELRARVDGETAGPAKERAWQALMRYLQTSLTRAELADLSSSSGGGAR